MDQFDEEDQRRMSEFSAIPPPTSEPLRAKSAPLRSRNNPHPLSASIVNNLPPDLDKDIKDREKQAASHVAFFRRPPGHNHSDADLEHAHQEDTSSSTNPDEAIKQKAKQMTFFANAPSRISRAKRTTSFGTHNNAAAAKQGSSGALSIPGSGSFKLLRNISGDISFDGRRPSGRTAFEEAVANIELQRQDTSHSQSNIDGSCSTTQDSSKRSWQDNKSSRSHQLTEDSSRKSNYQEDLQKNHDYYGHHGESQGPNNEDDNQKSIFPSQRNQDPNPAMPDPDLMPMPMPDPAQPPQPELEYDNSGNVTKASFLRRNQPEGAVTPGAYSATLGAAQRLPTPENYGQLGQIGEAYGWNSQEFRTASQEFKASASKELKSGSGHSVLSSTKSNDNNNPSQPPQAQQLVEDTLEEGTERSIMGHSVKSGLSVVSGTLMEPTTSWYQRKPFVLFLFLVVVGLIVAVVVLMLGNQSQQTAVQETQPEEVTEVVEEEPQYIIPNMTQAMIEAIQIKASQQEQAYDWMSRDPDLDKLEDWRVQQRYALMCFYFGVTGNFLDQRFAPYYDTDECQWLRSTDACQGNDRGEIRFVQLAGSAVGPFLRGTIPPEFSFLSSLEGIRLSYLNLKPLEELLPLDLLPSSIKSLEFKSSDLGGSMPATLGLLTGLTNLEIVDGGLVSSIPSQLGLLTKLESLVLTKNGLTGTIPTELANIPSLTNFQIEENRDLEPPLPSGFCSDDHEPLETLLTDWCSGASECCSR